MCKNLLNIVVRNVETVQKNLFLLETAVSQNDKTKNDPEIKQLLHEQRDLTSNISSDPRQAYQQLQLAEKIGDRLSEKIKIIEPNTNADVVKTAERNSQHLKFAIKVALVCAAVVAAGTGLWWVGTAVVTLIPAGTIGSVAAKLGLGFGAADVMSAANKDKK
jgi:hypothetical protein